MGADIQGKDGGVMHPNTKWLMDWCDRMTEKHGNPDADNDWCRKLAYHMGEEGNDYPSNKAIKIAEQWEKRKVGK